MLTSINKVSNKKTYKQVVNVPHMAKKNIAKATFEVKHYFCFL